MSDASQELERLFADAWDFQMWTLARVVLEGVEEALSPHIVNEPERSLLWAPLTHFPNAVPISERPRLEQAARDAILTSVVPAYREFLRFMEDEYLPVAHGTIGASELPAAGGG